MVAPALLMCLRQVLAGWFHIGWFACVTPSVKQTVLFCAEALLGKEDDPEIVGLDPDQETEKEENGIRTW